MEFEDEEEEEEDYRPSVEEMLVGWGRESGGFGCGVDDGGGVGCRVDDGGCGGFHIH